MENIKTIVVTEYDDADTMSLIIHIRVLDSAAANNFPITDAVRKAVHDYLCTQEGKEQYKHNCECFNWADFNQFVPNEICRKYGFEKVDSSLDVLDVNWDEHLADDAALDAFWNKEN